MKHAEQNKMNNTTVTKAIIYEDYNNNDGWFGRNSSSSSSSSDNYLWFLTWPAVSLLFIICCYIFICVRKKNISKSRDRTLDDTYGYHNVEDDIFRSSNNVEEGQGNGQGGEARNNSYIHVSKSDLSV